MLTHCENDTNFMFLAQHELNTEPLPSLHSSENYTSFTGEMGKSFDVHIKFQTFICFWDTRKEIEMNF